ncbi:MAG: hypothetical protein WD877_02345 [Candidatus Saccharimonadales bacterium]
MPRQEAQLTRLELCDNCPILKKAGDQEDDLYEVLVSPMGEHWGSEWADRSMLSVKSPDTNKLFVEKVPLGFAEELDWDITDACVGPEVVRKQLVIAKIRQCGAIRKLIRRHEQSVDTEAA